MNKSNSPIKEQPFITRVDYEDRTEIRLFDGTVHTRYRHPTLYAPKTVPPAQPQESTGLIRYVLAQAAVIGGLFYGIAENNPHFVVGSVVLCTASCVWFIRKMLRRERNAK